MLETPTRVGSPKNIQKSLTAIFPTESKRSLSEIPRPYPTPKPMPKEAKEKSARSKCFTHDGDQHVQEINRDTQSRWLSSNHWQQEQVCQQTLEAAL